MRRSLLLARVLRHYCCTQYYPRSILSRDRSRLAPYTWRIRKGIPLHSMAAHCSSHEEKPMDTDTFHSKNQSLTKNLEKEENLEVKEEEEEEEEEKEDTEMDEVTLSQQDVPGDTDRYSYFKKGFTTEIYKIEIHNLPVFVGFKQVKKRLKSMNLNPVKVKIGPRNSWCFVTFRSEEEKQAALQVVTGHVWKNRTLTATVAAPATDPLAKRKRRASGGEEEDSKRPHQEECDSPRDVTERLTEAVTPLLGKPYAEQLEMKLAHMRKFLTKAALLVAKTKPWEWFNEHVASSDGMLCPLDPVRASPVLESYRNKCEFTIGYDATGNPVVGFRLGSYKNGDLSVVSPDSCVHVPQPMKDIVKTFDTYIKQSSKPPYDPYTGHGYWKQVTVRCYTTGETMATVILHPQELTKEEIESEKQLIKSFFESSDGFRYQPTSLYLQCIGRKTSSTPGYHHLLGEQHVHEELLGLKFRVSPDAFFQVNTAAAGVLYSTIAELCATDSDTKPLVYDICCGTGTIGLCLTKCLPVSQVVGVEMSRQAVDDACANARLNGVATAKFMCSKAEDVLPVVMAMEKNEVIAVADPPRCGLHAKVVRSIRQCKKINKLVYASCSPDGALNNIIDLCRNVSNRLKGLPFRPVRAIPVDMFPHTSHCELLLLFERLPESDTPCQPTAPLESEDHTASPSHEPLSSPLADSELQNTPPSLVLSDLQNTSPETKHDNS